MQVLKFGGTSVADAGNMQKVVETVARAVDKDRTILVCSAISGCTDTLIRIGTLASERDESYKGLIDTLQQTHHNIIRELLPLEKHEDSTEVCDGLFESLRGIAQGVYLLGELSSASLDAIQGLGEILSTKIMATKLASIGMPFPHKLYASPSNNKGIVNTSGNKKYLSSIAVKSARMIKKHINQI